MFNPVHHHCHLFTDFYKGFTCAELKSFLLVRKSDTLILWRACLLVVPAGLDPRTYSIRTLHLIELRATFSIEIRNNMPAKKEKDDVLVVGGSEDGNSEVAKGGYGLINKRISD